MNIEREALVVLAERGWARCDFGYDPDTPLCMGGALREASRRLGGGLLLSRAEMLARTAAVIVEQYPEFARYADDPGLCVITWNDRRGRTLDEVVAVLEKAALRRDEMA